MSAKQIASAGVATATAAAIPATATIRTYFSRPHIFSARHSVEKARAIEESKDQPPKTQEHRMYVINAVMSSVAFLEAAINEVYQDAADKVEYYLASWSDQSKELIRELWKEERSLKTLQKYQLALTCMSQPKFDTGAQPYQAARLVIDLRNALVHPRPTQDIGDKKGQKLANKLLGVRFRLNPLTGEGNPDFPDKCLGYGCAKWALESCERFVAEFDSRVGLQRTPG